ncbi:MAG: B12-binding domain-containing radical SAM protein [Candidatus Parvarchaeota archaeon]|nr:B12-binding domain-containing radical SAM protein [Candidatus Jingweiarchaeum tengchongense]MCW1298415.1 B12-binding domain-containing radical SAM protein [Candidatus Jingweiarchaeum tengchongense]MCW1310825.1 B12-binding domain-containing radical SAM protein [Candidatus Jingweiarchaeum tengchongense]
MILLINPLILEKRKTVTPLSLLYLYSVLESHGFEVMLLHEKIRKKEFINMIKRLNVNFAGITTTTSKSLLGALKITKILKSLGITVFWGGPHATMLPNQTLSEVNIDGVVIGEGERTILELAKNFNKNQIFLKNIKGIMFKRNNKIISCPPQKLIDDLDSLPFPAWYLIKDFPKLYSSDEKYAFIESSRGCPFKCGFCFKQFGYKWRYKSIPRTLAEMKYLSSLKISNFYFVDDNFLISRKRVIKLCKNIIKEFKEVKWYIRGARVDQVDAELINIMKKAGCESISFGVESGSQRILDMINKQTTIKKVEKAFKLCNKVGIETGAFFIVDFPNETKSDLIKTIKLIKKIKPSRVVISYYMPYPGTRLYQKCKECGFTEPKNIVEWAKCNSKLNRLSKNNPIIIKTLTKMIDYINCLEYNIKKTNLLDAVKVSIRYIYENLKKNYYNY